MHHQSTDINTIAEMLVLNGSLTECPGLVHGKTGIAVFFLHYAKYTGNRLYEEYAMDLLNEMQSQIHSNSPTDYERGIAGIGVGIDYLINNNLLQTEGDDIFADFDARMYRAVMYDPWLDFTLYDGLTGYGRYWNLRLRRSTSNNRARECLSHIIELINKQLPDISEKEQTDVFFFLHDLLKTSGFEFCSGLLKRCNSFDISFPRLCNSIVDDIARKFFINQESEIEIIKKSSSGMGLLTGFAGEGMLHLSKINKSNLTWLHLI